LESPTSKAEHIKNPSLKSASINHYVAKSGNDSNPGTLTSPFLTITKGLSVASAGDTVFVTAGTYQEYVEFPDSGTTWNSIVLKNYGTDTVTVDAQTTRIYCIYIHNKNYITVDGINVANSTTNNVLLEGA